MLHISYNSEIWHTCALPKEGPKKIQMRWDIPWVLLTSALFHQESANFGFSRNTDKDCILIYNF